MGISLVAVGSLLLLNTLGIIDWAVWPYLLRWWPVILIFSGLEIIFRRRLFALLMVLMFIAGTAYYVHVGQPQSWQRYFMWNKEPESLPLFRWQQEIINDVEAANLGLDYSGVIDS